MRQLYGVSGSPARYRAEFYAPLSTNTHTPQVPDAPSTLRVVGCRRRAAGGIAWRLKVSVSWPSIVRMFERRGRGCRGRAGVGRRGPVLACDSQARSGRSWASCCLSDDKIDELCAYVQKTSPVLDILRNPVPVSVTRA